MTGLNLCPYESPCTPDCPKRCAEPNCHSTCKEFLKFRAKVDADTQKKYIKSDLSNYQTRQIERNGGTLQPTHGSTTGTP